MLSRTRRTGLALLGSAVALSLAATGGAEAASPAVPVAVTVASAVSSAHPFSDPIWYPVRDRVRVGCGYSNPGCEEPHNFWTQILTPLGQSETNNSMAGVFSMGAGIAHIGQANGAACGSGDASYGTWVWVDHGGGTISRYGHLSTILIRDGQLVAPGDQLGVMGTTGKRSSDSCFRSYLDFQLKAKGPSGVDYEFPTLQACRAGVRETWPTAISGHATWNATPVGTEMPVNDSSCLPTAAPATGGRPGNVKLANTAGNKVKVSWTRAPAGVDKVRLEFAQYHPSTKAYDAAHRSVWKDVRATATSNTFSVVNKRRYRVRVWFHTAGAGWNVGSLWVATTVK